MGPPKTTGLLLLAVFLTGVVLASGVVISVISTIVATVIVFLLVVLGVFGLLRFTLGNSDNTKPRDD